MRKKERLKLLKNLVIEEKIQKQEEFVTLLAIKGVEVTQATISRDIAKLHLVKEADEEGALYYALPTVTKDEKMDYFLQVLPMIQDLVCMQNELMLTVLPGSALRVKRVLLRSYGDKIFVALADDDGVFIKTYNVEQAQEIVLIWERRDS